MPGPRLVGALLALGLLTLLPAAAASITPICAVSAAAGESVQAQGTFLDEGSDAGILDPSAGGVVAAHGPVGGCAPGKGIGPPSADLFPVAEAAAATVGGLLAGPTGEAVATATTVAEASPPAAREAADVATDAARALARLLAEGALEALAAPLPVLLDGPVSLAGVLDLLTPVFEAAPASPPQAPGAPGLPHGPRVHRVDVPVVQPLPQVNLSLAALLPEVAPAVPAPPGSLRLPLALALPLPAVAAIRDADRDPGAESAEAPRADPPGAAGARDEPVRFADPPPVSAFSRAFSPREGSAGGLGRAFAGAGLAAAIALAGAALVAPVLALYRRVLRARALENPVRRAAYEFVCASPGATCADVARAAGVHFTTAERHLRLLAEFNYLVARRAAAGHRYFENHGRIPVAAERSLVALRNPANVALLEAVRETPGAGVTALAKRLGLAKSTVSRRARLLLDAGLLVPAAGGLAPAPEKPPSVPTPLP